MPASYAKQAQFVVENEARVKALRTQHWPDDKGKGRHPGRWTGDDLGSDCRLADTLENFQVSSFYETKYRWMCWYVHGASLAGIRDLTPTGVCAVNGLAYLGSSELALKICMLVMRETQLWRHDLLLRRRFKDVVLKRIKIMANVEGLS